MLRKILLVFLVTIPPISTTLSRQGEPSDSPIAYTLLQLRGRDGVRPIDPDPAFLYIEPLTNIRINFQKEALRKIVRVQDWLRTKDQVDSLTSVITDVKHKKDSLINLKPLLADSIRNAYNDPIQHLMNRRDSVVAQQTRSVLLFITALVRLRNGVSYDLEVPSYTTIRRDTTGRRELSSRTGRAYMLTEEGELQDRLVDTELDLMSEKLSDGDLIDLVIEDRADNLVRRYTKRFIVSERGWNLEFPASAVFVKRFREAVDSTGTPINPSNFKPAPGGSMLLSYRPVGSIERRLFLGFAVGINASLIDFEKDKDFELGVGFVAYWLNQSVGIGYGWNLHASEKSSYWFLSLDFLKTFQTFSGLVGPGS